MEAVPDAPETRRRLVAITLALLANAYSMSNPFPFGGFMVTHYDLTGGDERAVGFYAGLIMTAFMLGRMLASFPLGILSDKLGRRPVIELGLWSCIIPQLAFGLAPSFGLCLLCRFSMGLLNGIIGVSKAWIPELVAPEKQAFASELRSYLASISCNANGRT